MGSAQAFRKSNCKSYQEGAAQMKTILRSYRLYTSDDKERAAYEVIVAKMKARGTKCFRALGDSASCYYYAFASGEDGAAERVAEDEGESVADLAYGWNDLAALAGTSA